jgi:flavin-dependent dehydrogenase
MNYPAAKATGYQRHRSEVERFEPSFGVWTRGAIKREGTLRLKIRFTARIIVEAECLTFAGIPFGPRRRLLKIAIIGAGLTGSYLYRLLDKSRHEIDLFDRHVTTRCGIHPCAWGTSRDFAGLVAAAGLEPSAYVLVESDHVMIDGVRIRGDLMTLDKRRLIEDLRGSARIDHSEPDGRRYDRIIDCTGVARAMLPPVDADIVFPCVQYRIRRKVPLENRIRLTSIGYAWSFPLSHNEYHVGCGSLVMDPRQIIESTGWIDGQLREKEIVCACKSSVRLTSPHHSLPFVTGNGSTPIWGVGEAIGCVAPLAGDGIVPGMRSVQLLLRWWNNPVAYEKAVLREFRWMKDERRVIDKLWHNEMLGLKDAWVLKRNSRRMAMEVGLKDAAILMKHLRRPTPADEERPIAVNP